MANNLVSLESTGWNQSTIGWNQSTTPNCWVFSLGLALLLHAVEDFQSPLTGNNQGLNSGWSHNCSRGFKVRKFPNPKFSKNPDPHCQQLYHVFLINAVLTTFSSAY